MRHGISFNEAVDILNIREHNELLRIFLRADAIRQKHFGNNIEICSIINAKSGNCPQDCAFCAQSYKSTAKIEVYPLVDEKTILDSCENAINSGASRFSIVTSGKALSKKDLKKIASIISKIDDEFPGSACASLGILQKDDLMILKEAGLKRYHHNLETAESFFPFICSTSRYQDRIQTVCSAKSAGLTVCSGGIFGLGESIIQRVELLDTLKKLDVDSIPINFLIPIKGTRLETNQILSPFDCLKIIATSRLFLPDKSIRICGGREFCLGEFHSWIFSAGADSIMSGGYLTTHGRKITDDVEMIKKFSFINKT